jgi:predicted DCC family thiol-disulfide oxidoreductase YuxK
MRNFEGRKVMQLGQEYGKHGIVLFDGVCNLCTGSVLFILKRDKKDYFRFASLQSEAAGKMLAGTPLTQDLDTFVLVENGKIYNRSTAALRVARKLPGLWPLLYLFIVVPRFIRDGVYRYISANRYKWFGKKESCMIPTAELRQKFIA